MKRTVCFMLSLSLASSASFAQSLSDQKQVLSQTRSRELSDIKLREAKANQLDEINHVLTVAHLKGLLTPNYRVYALLAAAVGLGGAAIFAQHNLKSMNSYFAKFPTEVYDIENKIWDVAGKTPAAVVSPDGGPAIVFLKSYQDLPESARLEIGKILKDASEKMSNKDFEILIGTLYSQFKDSQETVLKGYLTKNSDPAIRRALLKSRLRYLPFFALGVIGIGGAFELMQSVQPTGLTESQSDILNTMELLKKSGRQAELDQMGTELLNTASVTAANIISLDQEIKKLHEDQASLSQQISQEENLQRGEAAMSKIQK